MSKPHTQDAALAAYQREHNVIADAIDHTAARPDATLEQRRELAGKSAMLRLAASGCTDPDQLRAASRAAREAL